MRFHLLATLLCVASSATLADGPPQSNGVISNPTLVQNQNIAKAQAAGAITTFMSEGSKTCDEEGKNCTSVFGQDDTVDYTRLQMASQTLTGVSSFSFMDDSDTSGGAKSISSQMGTLALACGEYSVKKVAGIAFKLTNCAVTATGDAQVTVQVCSAPMRGNPITPPQNEVVCSDDPAAPNFRAPTGFVCKRPACDTQPLNSLDGWSAPKTISYLTSLPATATAEEKTQNGLGLIFYPPLTGGTPASFTADSDTLTAVKVVQTFINNETKQTAVGLKVAYRHKTQVTREMMIQGPTSVPNPGANTAQWDTMLKLQGNEKIPQYQKQYGAAGTECLQQITNGLATDGKVSVCDTSYTNESGIKPLATAAQLVVEGQDCGTTAQCIKQVVNTSTWEESCQADVPLAMRSCTTSQDYALEDISYTRTLSQEICHEQRTIAEYGCTTSVVVDTVLPYWAPIADLSANGSTASQTVLKFEKRFKVPFKATVVGAAITSLHVDNWMEIRLNGQRIWASMDGNLNTVKDGNTYTNCANESWEEVEFDWWSERNYTYIAYGVRCTQSDGSRVRATYSDACGWHCSWDGEYAVNIPIPVSLVRTNQDNILEAACFNNAGPSACNFQVQLQYLPWESFKVINQCSGYEAMP